MKTIDELRAERAVLAAQTNDLDAVIAARLAQTLVKCGGCGQAHEIKALVYIQTHWYEHPHGCMGGDTWHRGEGRWSCPTCGAINRLYNKPDVVNLKHLFSAVTDEHKD